MRKFYLAIFGGLVLVGAISVGLYLSRRSSPPSSSPSSLSPTPQPQAEQLSSDQKPQVSLSFSSDAHYATVNLTNLHSDSIEYNLIYTATVKNNEIQTGVNAAQKLEGKTTYSKKQLLGSESSGKFTYHTQIRDATLELTLRDSLNRSVYTATYPFTVAAGKTIELQPASL